MKKTEAIVKINGKSYQGRRIPCGLEKRDHCATCKADGGHLVYYEDGGMVDGKRKWIYVGAHLPEADPEYQPAQRICQREGCGNELPTNARRNAQYCSNACRMAAHRAKVRE